LIFAAFLLATFIDTPLSMPSPFRHATLRHDADACLIVIAAA